MVKAVVFSSLPAPFGCGQWKSIQISHWRPPAFSSQHVAIQGHYLEMQNLSKQKTKNSPKSICTQIRHPWRFGKNHTGAFFLAAQLGLMIPISGLQLGDRTFKCSSVGKDTAFCWLQSWNRKAPINSFILKIIIIIISNNLSGNLEKAPRLLFPLTCACVPGRGEQCPIVQGLFSASGDQSQLATSQLAIPAAPQPCLLEGGAALSTFPATCSFPLPGASSSTHTALGGPRQKTSPATCFGKAVLISPEHIGLQWDQVPEGKAAFFCSISDLNQHELFEVFYPVCFRDGETPPFSQGPS